MIMKKNNKGFSLVELIIAFAILGIVSGILVSIMISSSNMYRGVSSELSLQMQSQLVTSQLKEYIIDCNDMLFFYDDTLTVRNSDAEHVFEWHADDKTITYNGDLLATNVGAFSVSPVFDGRGVEILLRLEKNEDTYVAPQTVMLRNESVLLKHEVPS